MEDTGNILFSGVGGQGILLASEITVYALLSAGYDAKKSDAQVSASENPAASTEAKPPPPAKPQDSAPQENPAT